MRFLYRRLSGGKGGCILLLDEAAEADLQVMLERKRNCPMSTLSTFVSYPKP